MGIIFSTIRGALNLVLPFTTPSTPLLQDLIHTIILCGTLYYAPQIVDAYNNNHNAQNGSAIPHDPAQETPNVPIDENLILQSDTDDDDAGEDLRDLNHAPLPLAPTPPPGGGNIPHAHVEDAEELDNEGNWQNPAQFENEEAGPANPAPRPAHANRTIGTKKAKSIARRDQRRAYHEFHRSQAEQRRAEEESTRQEREAALAEAKARRAEEERRIAEKQRAERERKKEEERREAEEERERRERVVANVREQVERRGAVDLVKVAYAERKDRVWIEKLVRASGMIAVIEKASEGAKSKVMITGEGWMVRVDEELMRKAYADAVAYGDGEGRDGRVSFDDFGQIVEKAVLARAKAAV